MSLMNSFSFLLLLTLLPAGVLLAQPGSATATTGSNRQQELYDQYHGVSKKPATSTPVATTVSTNNRVEPERAASIPKPQEPVADKPAPSMSRDQSMSRETTSKPGRMAGAGSGFRIGVRGGATYPVYTEKIAGIDAAVGFTGGLVLNFGKGSISFQPEVNYTRYSQKVKDLFTPDVYTVSNDALEVPLFLKISSGTYQGNRFFVNIGPYGAYALSASIDGKKYNLNNTTGRFSFGAAAGFGAALKAGPGHVTIEVRGLYSLGDTDNGFSTDSKTIFGQGALGYIFPL